MEGILRKVVVVAVLVGFGCAVGASASPAVDSIALNDPGNVRIWNDDPTSVLTTGNTYTRTPPSGPESGGCWIKDDSLDDDGGYGGSWANRHNWRFSVDGGVNNAVFMNADPFEISADVTLSGSANIEGGLNVSPWWSKDVDGVFMLNTETGEIACWGGRLPFYSFTTNHGQTYTKGTTVNLAIQYVPRALTQAAPGIIKYTLIQSATTYESPWLAFDEGNPEEDPPYGLWGILNDARVGGWAMPKINTGDPTNWGQADFENVHYAPVPEPATLALLSLMTLAAVRRRR